MVGIEWPLILFTVFAGAGAGVLVFAGVAEFFDASKKSRYIAAIVAIILLVIGGCFSLLHLGNPGNFMAAAANIFSFSPISLELIFLGLAVLVALIYLVLVNRESSAAKILGIIGIVVGLCFAYFSGHGYQVIEARPAWATPLLTFSYALSALAMGGFIFLAIQAIFKDEMASIKRIALIVLIVAVLTALAYLAYAATTSVGSAAALLWIGAVVIGGLGGVGAALYAYMKGNISMIYLGL
ncbi:MAG: dimethyl sulfoxide reductase anchor subunit, partial [Coriobacteriaceae bacterium]|nr:dimethyl sulfoxide reductase anchor subunit [Coriobacteriaceae bacterium]